MLAQVAAPPPVAQTAMPDAPVAPPTVSAAPAAPAAPVFAPAQPMVQSTPSVEENRAAAVAAAEAEAAARPAPAPRRAVASRVADAPVERVAPAAAPVARTQAPAAVVPPVAEPAPVAPVAPVVAEQDAAPIAAAPVTESVARPDNALLWAMGGAALLLAGLGGAALMRRRRPTDAIEDETVVAATPVAAPREAVLSRPIIAPMATPAPAMAARAPDRQGDDRLEAMVAAAPSAENPFRTRTKRMRRAQYLLAQRTERPASAAPVMQTPAAQPAPAPAVDRSQTVYRYGGPTMRPAGLKPRTR